MPVLKCKMCGGTLSVDDNTGIATCEFCGTKQTLPKLDNEKKLNLYDRANHFRRNNEYDKASLIYEQILSEDNTDAESYWSLVLCKYGIEYVEDPATHKRVPTVNRAQYTSIFSDSNYKKAIEHASADQKKIYEDEAQKIDEIQKGILAISSKEDPFDIFICYKETDANGRRTMDSVLAQDLYNQLTKEGYKVFFSRIVLEDKLGTAYEPYIFAALNSARVMIVVGTCKENFNAVWVKNEWSRYLSLINQGQEKTLIPAYRDMDPYDLPDEFSYLQAQDMNKLGFMQDLLRGINKITGKDKQVKTVVSPAVDNAQKKETFIKRMYLFIEDKQYKDALQYSDQILEIDPENYNAYLGKLLSELELTRKEDLATCDLMYEDNPNYEKAVRFADPESKQILTTYAEKCRSANADIWIKQAEDLFNKGDQSSVLKAKDIFTYLSKWYLLEDKISKCNKAIDDIRSAEEKKVKAKKRNRIIIIAGLVLALFAGVFFVVNQNYIQPAKKYNNAINLINDNKPIQGLTMLDELGDYKDSKTQIINTMESLLNSKSAIPYTNISFFNIFLNCKDDPKFETVAKTYMDKLFSYAASNQEVVSAACEAFPELIKNTLTNYVSTLNYDSDIWTAGNKISKFTKYLSNDSELELIVRYLSWETRDDVSVNDRRSLWNKYKFVQDLETSDEYIFDFMVGNWTTSDGQYFTVTKEDDGHHFVSYSLPYPAEPAGTEYINFRDKIFTFDDANVKELAKVYKFTFTGYDKANVYCYSNNRTYTITRQ